MGISYIILLIALLVAIGVGINMRRRHGLALGIAGGGATFLAIVGAFMLLITRM